MKSKWFALFTLIALILGIVAVNQTVAQSQLPCDAGYVFQNGNVITIRPTGVDDTANIQCAFDTAVANGSGTNVHLGIGTFYTAQIVVNDFVGSFTGSGIHQTQLVNLPNLYVTPTDMYFQPPSAENPWPTLLAFVNGDFSIADLSVQITGEEPTTGWSIFGIQPPIKEMAGAIYILGTQTNAVIENVGIYGETVDNPDSWWGYNLINGIFFEGFIGETPVPISGSFEVYHSNFKQMAGGTPLVNLVNAEVTISHNQFEDVFDAVDGGDFVDSTVTFSNNKVSATVGLNFYNVFSAEDANTTFIIMENTFSGNTGVLFENTFGADNKCLILDNKMSRIEGTGISLNAGTKDCFVVADRTSITDLGTDNIILGKHNTISYE